MYQLPSQAILSSTTRAQLLLIKLKLISNVKIRNMQPWMCSYKTRFCTALNISIFDNLVVNSAHLTSIESKSDKVQFVISDKVQNQKEIKMQVKPMNTIKEALVLAGLHPVDKNASDAKKIISILGFVVIMSFQLEGISFSLAFWIKYWKVDLEKSLYTIVQIAATSCIIYPLIVAFFLRPKVASMFVNLTKIYHACK